MDKKYKSYNLKGIILKILVCGFIGLAIGILIAYLFRNANLPSGLLYGLLPIYLFCFASSYVMISMGLVGKMQKLVYFLLTIIIAPVIFIIGSVKLYKRYKETKEEAKVKNEINRAFPDKENNNED